ncbi:polyprenyl synthetase family protein [Hyphococcus flavus]|uniref:Polyprenyl synthetase family protein n=1 Tax=Hyphococcus flavus TaxID=1866326 RepID=A0AAE9ZHZ2_9PROT|nr:polyprenyl synthetase family protein [Hyphococcus flavus]WDI33212.1 polyprenyl synthetase family protein [Hyphococcus flavus]
MSFAATATDQIAQRRAPRLGSREADFLAAVTRLQKLTAADLEAVNGEILSRMQSPVRMIPELAGHLIKAGGKRLRPMLTLASANLLNYQGNDHVKLAASVELIHGATLLHDDVVDGSALRRGASTANIIWGNKESVLVGDFIFARAFELMVEAKDLRVLHALSHASGIIAQGEVLQLTTQKNLSATFETYLEVVEAKTAALFAAATEVGGLISGRNPQEEAAIRNFGLNFGIAYQLIDDALDYAGFEATLGKTVGDDFREGKMTAPVVFAVARARDDEKSFWRRAIANGDIKENDFEKACSLMERDSAIEDTILCARRYADKALEALAVLPDNTFSSALGDLVTTSTARAS